MSELMICNDLCKSYGGVQALKNVNIRLESGKIYGLLGPNGSGKTTLIKLINGLLTPTSGNISILGNAPGVFTKSVISYLPDNSYLNNWMRVEQIVDQFRDFYSDFRGIEQPAKKGKSAHGTGDRADEHVQRQAVLKRAD